ncbi:MAG: flagellar assembly protein FliH [Enterobacteriaceae bacterium]
MSDPGSAKERSFTPLWGQLKPESQEHSESGRDKPDPAKKAWGKTEAASLRRHRFPPLRKPWVFDENLTQELEPADYQQQLMDGFQEGVAKGFAQGLEEGREQGYPQGVSQGHEEGRKQGEREGRQLGKALFDTAAQPLEQMAAQMHQAMQEYEQRRRSELVQLVEKVTRQVIRCELALQPAQLLALVEEALQAQPTAPEQLKVLLNPEEFARIKDLAPEKVQEWGLAADSALEPGECKVVTDSMEIDVGCQHRLEQCIEVLQENLLAEEPEYELNRAG